jgi:signal peptidase I
MKQSQRLPSIFSNLLLLAGLAVIWIAFAPAKVGGQASYVMVNGISMEPSYHTGDLVIVRKAHAYQVGDVVTYHDAELGAFIIHRIISIEQGQFIIKGDNNSWLDPYHPTQEEIIGKQWIYVPKVGRAMQWLLKPVNLSLTVVLFGGAIMVSLLKPSQRGKRKNNLSGNSGEMLEGGLYLFGFLALFFLGLSIFAFIRPLTHPMNKIQYQQESQFSYSATGTPVIYDTGVVRSGEPVFPRLTCSLNIAFTYTVPGNQLQGISGNYQLIARVLDEQSGWQRTIPMNEWTAFNGNSFSTMSSLDLCQIVSLVNTLKQETGLRASNFRLEIIPQVIMTANSMGNQITDSFEPKLVFEFDEVHFSLSTPKGQDDPLRLSKQSSANNSNVEANTLSVLGWRPTIQTVRMIALLGLGLSFIGLMMIGFRTFAMAKQSQDALIRLRYGALLVNVYERDFEPGSRLIDVTTIDELAKLAERHNTVMLHMTINFLHYYVVQCNGATYRYVFSAGKRGVAEIEPARQEIVGYPIHVNEKDMVEAKPRKDELFGYVVNTSRIAKAEVEETVILRTIRL